MTESLCEVVKLLLELRCHVLLSHQASVHDFLRRNGKCPRRVNSPVLWVPMGIYSRLCAFVFLQMCRCEKNKCACVPEATALFLGLWKQEDKWSCWRSYLVEEMPFWYYISMEELDFCAARGVWKSILLLQQKQAIFNKLLLQRLMCTSICNLL